MHRNAPDAVVELSQRQRYQSLQPTAGQCRSVVVFVSVSLTYMETAFQRPRTNAIPGCARCYVGALSMSTESSYCG